MQLEAQGTARWQCQGARQAYVGFQRHTRPTFGDEPHSSQSSIGASGSQDAMWCCVLVRSQSCRDDIAPNRKNTPVGMHQKGLKALAPANCFETVARTQ